jgi:hypothetical protein
MRLSCDAAEALMKTRSNNDDGERHSAITLSCMAALIVVVLIFWLASALAG